MRILLITNNLNNMIIISNYINLNIDISSSVLLAQNINSANLLISEYDINLIILDENIFNYDFYTQYIKLIPIILITNSTQFQNTNYKFETFSTNCISNLSTIINKHITIFNNISKSRSAILNQLLNIGFNIKHRGTKYLAESILIFKYYCHTTNMKNIYSIIAQKYNTSGNNIKSNISKAINYMYYETDFSHLCSYFSLTEDIRPTAKQIILNISEKV